MYRPLIRKENSAKENGVNASSYLQLCTAFSALISNTSARDYGLDSRNSDSGGMMLQSFSRDDDIEKNWRRFWKAPNCFQNLEELEQ